MKYHMKCVGKMQMACGGHSAQPMGTHARTHVLELPRKKKSEGPEVSMATACAAHM